MVSSSDYKGSQLTFGVMNVLIIVILVMASWVYICQNIKFCTLNMYNLLYFNYASGKLFLKMNTVSQ